MITCNNCLHNDICNIDGYIDAGECGFFKNKADFVEVKHGEWIRPTIIHGITIAGLLHCSVCGEVPCNKGKYCPNCGAKMDEKNDNDLEE